MLRVNYLEKSIEKKYKNRLHFKQILQHWRAIHLSNMRDM